MGIRRRLPLRGLVPGASLALSFMAAAAAMAAPQPGDQCVGLATPADEIACLRSALKAKSEAEGHASKADRKERNAQRQAPAPATPADLAQPTQSARAQPAPAAAPAPAPAQARQELGREQLPGARSRDRDDVAKREALQAVVLAVKEDREGLFSLTLDNGQVWKQTEKPTIQVTLEDRQQYPVEISKSGFGGYRMYFSDIRRAIVVRRVL